MKKKTLPEKWFIRGSKELKIYMFELGNTSHLFDLDDHGYFKTSDVWSFIVIKRTPAIYTEISLQDYIDSLVEDEASNNSLDDLEPHLPEPSDIKHPFQQLTESMFELYKRKNKDYGDSFSKGFSEYGMIMPCIRLEDKFMRFKQLVRSGEQEVKDEKIEDTLIDMANYAIMTLIELKKKKYAE